MWWRKSFGKRRKARRYSPRTKANNSLRRKSRLALVEPLEQRLLLRTTIFMDFGVGIGMGNTLSTDVATFRDIYGVGIHGGDGTGSDMTDPSVGMAGGDSLDFTPLAYDFNLDGSTDDADIQALANAVIPIAQRALEPFDIDVVVGTATSIADTVAAVGANAGDPTGEYDAYCFVMDCTSDAFGGGSVGDWVYDNTGLYGIAAADDLYNQGGNTQDEAIMAYSDNLFDATSGTAGTAQFNENLAYRIAYTATHEAFHTFTYVHTVNQPSSGDIIRYGSVTREDPFIVTRFDLARQGGYAVAEPNNYLQAANDPDIGLRDDDGDGVPNLAYVTGTGAHDVITLTSTGLNTVDVLVEAYSDSAHTTLISSEIYNIGLTLDTEGEILIDASINNDEIVIDPAINATIRVRGGSGVDGVATENDVVIVQGDGTQVGSYTPSPTQSDAGTISVAGGAQILFDEVEPVVVGGFNEFTFITPNSNDVLTVDSPGAGQNRVSGTSGGVAFESLTFSNVTHFKIDTAANDAPLGNFNDTVTFTADLVATGLGSFTVETGAGNDRVLGGSVSSLGMTILGGAGDDWLTGGAHNDRLEGGDGNDYLWGSSGDDALFGDAGRDELYAGSGNNQLYGGDDADVLASSGGDDWADGGGGEDVFSFADSSGAFTVAPDPFYGTNMVRVTGPTYHARAADVEQVFVGLPSLDAASSVLVQDLSGIGVQTVGLSRFLFSILSTGNFTGTITIEGTAASDTIRVADTSIFGSSQPTVFLPWGRVVIDDLVPEFTSLTIDALTGDDVVKVEPSVTLGATAVILTGGDGDDLLSADATLNGGDGNDILVGGAGSDTMNGGAGDDTFIGNGGTDTVNGGTGFDTILVPGTDAADTISVAEAAGAHTVTINSVATTYAAGSTFERILVEGGVGDDSVTASGAVVGLRVEGGADNDTVDASAVTNAATLLGEDGNDVLTAAQGGGLLDGGHDDDVLIVNGGLTGTLQVIGGDPSASDVLDLVGQAQTVETVTIELDSANVTEQDVTGLGATIDVSGVELITYTGADLDDTLIIDPGNGDNQVRVENLNGSDLVTSDSLPDISYDRLDTLRVVAPGQDEDIVTFNLGWLDGALDFETNLGINDTLVVEGIDATGDHFRVRDPGVGSVAVTSFLGNANTVTDISNVGRLELNTQGGDDLVTVDESNGLVGVPITYDGGANTDTLLVTGTLPVDIVAYRPGPDVLEGRLTYDRSITGEEGEVTLMTIDFVNLEPIVDLVPVPAYPGALQVFGTDADNAINYIKGPNSGPGHPVLNPAGVNTGLITVDAYEGIEFANKDIVEIFALAGDDVINLNNPTVPKGAADGLVSLFVEGNDPTASDKLIVNGTSGRDTIDYQPSSPESLGNPNQVFISALPRVDFLTMESLVINGQGGTDALTVTTPSGQQEITFTPGAAADAGSIDLRTLNTTSLVPLEYKDIGALGSLTFANEGGMRADVLLVNGTDVDDEFFVNSSGQLQILKPNVGYSLYTTVLMSTPGIDSLGLRGLDGDDIFHVPGNHPFPTQLAVEGGNPSASDVLDFTSSGGDVTVDLELQTVTETGNDPVAYTGIETLNVDLDEANLDVDGTGDDEDVTVTVFDADSGKIERGYAVQRAGQVQGDILAPVIYYSDIDGNAVNFDLGGGEDTLIVVGSTYGTSPPSPDAAQVFDIDVPGRSVDIDNQDDGFSDGEVTWVAGGIESLEAWGLEGADTFNVVAGSIPVFIDGGDPIGVTAGDKFGIIGGGGGVAYEAGPENDEGGIRVGSNARISFDHIEEGEVHGAGCALVVGTNGDDDITIIARNELDNPAQFVGTDGVQDFTSSVNAGLQILWTDVPELYIDALAGDDDIVLRTRAPDGVAAAGDWDMEVYIVGGAPSAATGDQGDVVEIETPYQADDDVVYTPTGSETGEVLLDENGNGSYDGTDTLIQIVSEFVIDCDGDDENEYRSSTGGVEQLIYEGESGDDELTVAGPGMSGNTYVHTPGAMIDAGTVAVNTWLPIDYHNLGSGGTVIVHDSTAGASSGTLVYEGTALDDQFNVRATTGTVELENAVGDHVPVEHTGVENLSLHGLDGDDAFDVHLSQLYNNISLEGGGPGNSDLLTVWGDPAVIEDFNVDLSAVDGTGRVDVNGLDIDYAGVEDLHLAGNGILDSLTIEDDEVSNVWEVTDGQEDGWVRVDDHEVIEFYAFGVVSLANEGGVDRFRVSPTGIQAHVLRVLGDGAGYDVIELIGTDAVDTVSYDPGDWTIVTVNGVSVQPLGLAQFELYTLGGNDSIDLNLTTSVVKVVDAGGGDDTVDLTDATDATIFGGLGDDTLTGTALADSIYGGPGNDTINGLGGVDTIYGGAGNDSIVGGPGNDDLFGGDGSDLFTWNEGDGSDLIEGDVGQDELLFNGATAAQHAVEDIFLWPESQVPGMGLGDRVVLARTQGLIELKMAGVETINIDGGSGDENFHVFDLYATDAQVVNLDFGGVADGTTETAGIHGRVTGDNIHTELWGGAVATQGLRYDVNLLDTEAANDVLTIYGNEGDDTIKVEDGVESFIALVLNGGAGDDYLSADATLNGGPGDDFLEGGSGADTLNGGAGEDTMIGGGGNDVFDGGADFDTILIQGTSGNDVIDVVEDFGFSPNVRLTHTVNGTTENDEIVTTGVAPNQDVTVERALVQAGDGEDLIRVRVLDGFYDDDGGSFGLSMVMAVEGGSQIAAGDRLVIVDDDTDDLVLYRKGVTDDEGTVTIGPANDEPFENVFTGIEYVQFVDDSGAAINPEPGNLSRLVVFKHDPFEYNNDRFVATYLGVNQTTNVDPKIDPGALVDPFGDDPDYTIPGDEDWFRVEAEVTGTLDFQVFFEEVGELDSGRPGLPSDGNLDIGVYDVDGTLIAGSGTFGTNDGAGDLDVDGDDFAEDERVRIPAVQGQTYLLRVYGVETAINNYSLSVINAAAPVPYDIELNDIIVADTVRAATVPTATVFQGNVGLSSDDDFYNGKYVHFTSGALTGQRAEITDYHGLLRRFTVAVGSFTGAPAALDAFFIETHDTGRSQFDDVTRDNTPIIVLRLDDAIFLHDLPGNPTDDTPPDEVIVIPFNSTQTAVPGVDATNGFAAGYRVAVFDEGTPQQPGQLPQVPVGYARQIAEGVYEFDFETDAVAAPFVLTDGSHFLSAKVQMIDPADPTRTGFGQRSVSLEVIIDTAAPPVYFGLPANAEDGLHPDSDSGVQDEPGAEITLDDRVTNDETPTFFGQAEADAYIRVYVDVDNDGVVDSGDFLVAETVAIPEDGTNQFPGGHWEATSYVNMNDQDLLAALEASGVIAADQIDRLRPMLVTAEDVAGNVSEPDQLNIFIDTQGPRITDVEFNERDDPYDVFDPKPSEDGPTPLVNSLVISVSDMPWRSNVDPNFLYEALWEDIAEEPGHYLVVGDANGVIPILEVIFESDTVENNQPATGTVTLVFWRPGVDGVFHTDDDLGAPLPDDRFTLTISDSILDPVGNALDGENNAVEPQEDPQFPTGDGNPGGDFVARFTVDSRPEIGTWAAGSIYVDTNGNFIFDPDNLDYTNRDIVYTMGFTSDDIFAGNFAAPGVNADGFDKLAAYGHNQASLYRWLVDVDNDGVVTPGVDVISVEPAWFDGLGTPVAGNFDGNAANGDEVGLFNGSTWYLDGYSGPRNFLVSDEVAIPGIQGYPIVGDFDGDDLDDLGTYLGGVFSFDLAADGLGDGLDVQFAFNYLDFIGVRERPVAHDFNQDGIDDIGLWVPDRAGVPLEEGGEWFILVSGGGELVPNTVLDRIVEVEGLAVVEFTPIPFGPDMYAQFGDEYAAPVVGNFDPPVTGSEAPDPTLLSLEGTEGDDTLVLVVDGPGQATALLNGIPLYVGPDVTTFEFDGLAGKDTVSITASGGNETIELEPGEGAVTGQGFTISVTAESIGVDGGGGIDVALVRGAAGVKDTYRADAEGATMTGDGYTNEVVACRYVHGYGNTGDQDVALLFDNPATTDTFESWPGADMARMFGPGFYNRVKSFRWTHGYSTPGNQDVALLHDDPEQSETFESWPQMARLYASDHYTRVKLFRWVHAYGTPGNKDVALLHGDPEAADTFQAWPHMARLYGPDYYHRVKSFAYVHGYGTPGGGDLAQLYGSAGNDKLLATERFTALYGSGFYNRAVLFDQLEAHGGGGTDTALLYDAALEAGRVEYSDVDAILWLYQFAQIDQHDTETSDDTSTEVVDEVFTAYWM